MRTKIKSTTITENKGDHLKIKFLHKKLDLR